MTKKKVQLTGAEVGEMMKKVGRVAQEYGLDMTGGIWAFGLIAGTYIDMRCDEDPEADKPEMVQEVVGMFMRGVGEVLDLGISVKASGLKSALEPEGPLQ